MNSSNAYTTFPKKRIYIYYFRQCFQVKFKHDLLLQCIWLRVIQQLCNSIQTGSHERGLNEGIDKRKDSPIFIAAYIIADFLNHPMHIFNMRVQSFFIFYTTLAQLF
jgi:hypothetical protein